MSHPIADISHTPVSKSIEISIKKSSQPGSLGRSRAPHSGGVETNRARSGEISLRQTRCTIQAVARSGAQRLTPGMTKRRASINPPRSSSLRWDR